MKLDLDKILNATDYIQDVAQELGYENAANLRQLLDELDTKAINTLEEDG